MRVIEFSRLATFCIGAVLCAKGASAQGCQVQQRNLSRQVNVGGYYSYSAIGNGIPGSLFATTTGTPPPFSSTQVGQVLAGVNNTGPFASSGLLFLDNAGNIVGSQTPQGGVTTIVGTYTLNSSGCTITVTLKDAFGTNPTSTSLQGVVLRAGSEIDLGVLQNFTTGSLCTVGSSTGTCTGTSTVTTPNTLYGSNLLVKLVRQQQSPSCNAGILVGSYALLGNGDRVANLVNGTTSTQTQAPFFTLGLVQFDGIGSITSPSGPSTLSYLQFSGTYTVNPDCTGTMTLSNATSTSTSGTGTTTSTAGTSMNFVLIQPSAADSAVSSPEILFSQSGGAQTLFGTGIAQ